MKKILNVLAVCLSAALFVTGCASPSTSSGNGGNTGNNGNQNGSDGIRILFPETCITFKEDAVYFYIENQAADHGDRIILNILQNDENITLSNMECIWIENDTEEWCTKYGATIPYFSDQNLIPNVFIKFTADKAGDIKFYLNNLDKSWWQPTTPEQKQTSGHTLRITNN